MIKGILKCMESEIKETFHKKPTIIVTGGGNHNLKLENALQFPHLTILGLAKAYELNGTNYL
jgi:pantothenate kinase type III